MAFVAVLLAHARLFRGRWAAGALANHGGSARWLWQRRLAIAPGGLQRPVCPRVDGDRVWRAGATPPGGLDHGHQRQRRACQRRDRGDQLGGAGLRWHGCAWAFWARHPGRQMPRPKASSSPSLRTLLPSIFAGVVAAATLVGDHVDRRQPAMLVSGRRGVARSRTWKSVWRARSAGLSPCHCRGLHCCCPADSCWRRRAFFSESCLPGSRLALRLVRSWSLARWVSNLAGERCPRRHGDRDLRLAVAYEVGWIGAGPGAFWKTIGPWLGALADHGFGGSATRKIRAADELRVGEKQITVPLK